MHGSKLADICSLKAVREDSSAALALGALATATGLAFLVKRKKDDEESEDY